MRIRFIDDQGAEHALPNLTSVPSKGDAVIVHHSTGADRLTVASVTWHVLSSGDPPTGKGDWDVEIVLKS